MKNLLFLATLSSLAPLSHAQGPLFPSGAPAPEMKTLDQIEPRKPISSLPFIVGAPGSYYLTKNLVFNTSSGNAIQVNASNVSIDLNGFNISATTVGNGNCIEIGSAFEKLKVFNGSITGNNVVTLTGSGGSRVWSPNRPGGFDYGIQSAQSTLCEISNIIIRGCDFKGLSLGSQCVARSVVISSCGTEGLTTNGRGNRIIDCTATNNVSTGINCNPFGTEDESTVTGCVATLNGGSGISTMNGVVNNCVTHLNGGLGIYGTKGSVTICTATSNGFPGINAVGGTVNFSRATTNNIGNGTAQIDTTNGAQLNNYAAQ